MVRVHGDNFRRFLELVDEHDPDGKFTSTASPTALWPRTVVDGEFDRWVRAWPQKTRSSRCYRESFAGTTFGDETPLWYYVLKEAEVHS